MMENHLTIMIMRKTLSYIIRKNIKITKEAYTDESKNIGKNSIHRYHQRKGFS